MQQIVTPSTSEGSGISSHLGEFSISALKERLIRLIKNIPTSVVGKQMWEQEGDCSNSSLNIISESELLPFAQEDDSLVLSDSRSVSSAGCSSGVNSTALNKTDEEMTVTLCLEKVEAEKLLMVLQRSVKMNGVYSAHAMETPRDAERPDVQVTQVENIRSQKNFNDLTMRYNRLEEKTRILQRAFRQSQNTIKLLQGYYEEEKLNNASYDETYLWRIWSYMAFGVFVHVILAKGLNRLLL